MSADGGLGPWMTNGETIRELRAAVARLTAERDALAERVCPYVVTSDEGTSYCSLNATEGGL